MTGQAPAFRVQAVACAELGSPMYAELLARCADDLETGGVVHRVLAGHEHDPGPSALALRLLGSVHRLVISSTDPEARPLHPGLRGSAEALAAYYPSVGGTWSADAAWPVFVRLLRDHPDAVREWLDRPPQTNEVGRAAALYGGLKHLTGGLPVRLFEIGASAGLNLLADRFGYVDEAGRRSGDPNASVVLHQAWRGRSLAGLPEPLIGERLGSDLRPIDPTTPEGRLVLTAYTWPDQAHRLARLRAALAVAAQRPPEVLRQDARTFLTRLRLVDGTTTVLWHSVMWQYLAPADQAACADRIDEIGRRASPGRRFAHLRAEPTADASGRHRFLVHLRVWPDGADRLLAETVGHGIPTTWLPAAGAD